MSGSVVENKPIKIGVVGAGHMGQYHINLLSKILPENHIFIYDQDPERSKLMAETYQAVSCPVLEECLSAVDAVIIAVPTYLHYEYAMKAMKAGCHVLVEKPISNDLKCAQEMMAYAEENNLILHIGHIERFNGAVQAMRDIVDKPYYFQAQRIGSVSRIQDVGVVLDLMIHDIDIILSFVDSPVREVVAYGESIITDFEDYALATLYFENGTVATLTASRVSSHKARTMFVSQEKIYIQLDYSTNDLVVYKNQYTEYTVSQSQITYKEENIVDRVVVHKDNPLKLELEYFIDEISGNLGASKYKNILWDSHSNLYTMEIAFRILKEIERSGKRS